MKRHFVPGVVDRHGRARPDGRHMAMDDDTSFAFDEQGRRATNPVPRFSPLAGVPVQVTGGPVPRRRRARHFFRALWRFLTDRKARL